MGSLFGSSKKSKQSGTNTGTSTSVPIIPGNIQGYLDSVLAQGNTGDLVNAADFSDDQLAAFEAIRNINSEDGVSGQSLSYALGLLGENGGITPEDIQAFMNPYTQSVIDPALREYAAAGAASQAQARDLAKKAGAFGGSRSAMLEANVINDTNQGRFDLQNKGMAQAWDAALQAALQSKGLGLNAAGQAQNLGLNAASTLLQSGNLQQQQAQNELDLPLKNNQYLANLLASLSPMQIGQTTNSSATSNTTAGTSGGGSSAGKILGVGTTLLGMFGKDTEDGSSGGGLGGLSFNPSGIYNAAQNTFGGYARGGPVGLETALPGILGIEGLPEVGSGITEPLGFGGGSLEEIVPLLMQEEQPDPLSLLEGGVSPAKKKKKGVSVGGAASGAMTGAKLGSSILPGWGTAIGAVLGGIAGLFGGKALGGPIGLASRQMNGRGGLGNLQGILQQMQQVNGARAVRPRPNIGALFARMNEDISSPVGGGGRGRNAFNSNWRPQGYAQGGLIGSIGDYFDIATKFPLNSLPMNLIRAAIVGRKQVPSNINGSISTSRDPSIALQTRNAGIGDAMSRLSDSTQQPEVEDSSFSYGGQGQSFPQEFEQPQETVPQKEEKGDFFSRLFDRKMEDFNLPMMAFGLSMLSSDEDFFGALGNSGVVAMNTAMQAKQLEREQFKTAFEMAQKERELVAKETSTRADVLKANADWVKVFSDSNKIDASVVNTVATQANTNTQTAVASGAIEPEQADAYFRKEFSRLAATAKEAGAGINIPQASGAPSIGALDALLLKN